MPEHDFRLITVSQVLDNSTCLAEALFVPEVSCFGDDLSALFRALEKNARRIHEGLPVLELHRRRRCGPVRIDTTTLVLDPPHPVLRWREPVTLTFPLVYWDQEQPLPLGLTRAPESTPATAEACLAFIPALGIEVLAPDANTLQEMLPRHIRAALMRTRSSTSLERLVWLQRSQSLHVEELSFTANILSPKQAVIEEEERAGRQKSVLPEVGTDLAHGRPAPAYEIDDLVRRVAEALTGRRPRSVLLVGPAGVGKTAAVRELVRQRRGLGLRETPFWATSGSRLVAGMSGFGMWEQRCQQLWREASKIKAILHFGNLVELMEVGKSELRGQGIATFFRPYLARGDLLALAECTPEQLPLIERQDPHLLDAFVQIQVEEPAPQRARAILTRFASAAKPEGPPPLDDAALDTLDRLHRRYATYSAYPGRPLRFLQDLINDRPQGQPIRGADVTRAFARETGLPLFLLEESVPLHLGEAHQWFAQRVVGQKEAVDLVVDLLATVKAGLSRPRKPIGSLLFIGPTGVGKTEMAKALAEFLFGDKGRITRLDMSEYADPLAVQRLIGGTFAEEGILTARIREQPFSVVLLDEFEKAHPAFFDLLLQVLGEGRLTDAAGRLADFCNCVVIMTSNLGADTFQQGAFGFAHDAHSRDLAREHFVEHVRGFLRPELFNRIDRIVPFAPLDEETTLAICHRQLDLLRQRDGIRFRQGRLEVGPDVPAHLARKGYDARYGARPLKRAIERELLAPLADKMNRYAGDAALEAQVDLHDGELDVSVRARVDETGRQVLASGLGSTIAETALRCLDLRRNLQALRRGPDVQELHDEIALLRQRQKRRAGRPPRSPEEVEELTKLARLDRIAQSLADLHKDACRLEDEVLLHLYAQVPLDPELFDLELRTAGDKWFEVLLEVYFLRFPQPDALTLVVYSEEPQRMFELAGAYYQLVDGKGRTEVWQFLPTRAGRDQDATPERRKVLQPSEYFNGAPAIAVQDWDKITKRLIPENHSVYARDGVIGIALRIERTPGALVRLDPEAGLHVFTGPGRTERCLVDTSAEPLPKYAPPRGIDRRGSIGSQAKRRLYSEPQRQVEDLVLQCKASWPRDALTTVLAELIERRLRHDAHALVKP